MFTQLTDVVETANASNSANKIFLGLFINWRAYARRGLLAMVSSKQCGAVTGPRGITMRTNTIAAVVR
jgi:hypothetical protein